MSRAKKVPEHQQEQEQIHIATFSLLYSDQLYPPNHIKIAYFSRWSARLTQIRKFIASKVKAIVSFQVSYTSSNTWPGDYYVIITIEYTGDVLAKEVESAINEACK
jgi:hypothetical protein